LMETLSSAFTPGNVLVIPRISRRGGNFYAPDFLLGRPSPLLWGEGGAKRRVRGYGVSVEAPYPLTPTLSPWERGLPYLPNWSFL
jgi:hypothetical protein